jgi:hypothetical protein
MDSLDQVIKDSFSIISLLLVFVFVLFDVRYPEIQEKIKEDPENIILVKENKNFREELWKFIFLKCSPLIIILGSILYLLLPNFYNILISSTFNIWNFNFIRTSYFLVTILTAIFFIWTIYLIICLISNIYKTVK